MAGLKGQAHLPVFVRARQVLLVLMALMTLWATPTLAAWTPVGTVDAGMSHYFVPV